VPPRLEAATGSARGGVARAAWLALGAGFLVAMVAPLGCLLLYSLADRFSATAALPPAYSLRWYQGFFASPQAFGALLTSLAIAGLATVIALAAGLPAAWALARTRIRGADLVEGALLLRAAAPVIVVGLGSAVLLYRLRLVDTWPAVVLAHATGALPFVVWCVRPALEDLEPDADAAARDLGAGPTRRLALALRAVLPAVLSGALFAFLFSMDEFAVTFLIAGQRIVTLPILLYGALQASSVQAASAVAVVLIVPSALVTIAVAWAIGGWERALSVGRLR
jgi:ABC-type spermidine/putrescine transport system permease subunit II